MSDSKSLSHDEAIDKIKEIAANKIGLLCTYEQDNIVSRPMSTQAIDEDGTLWFFSRKDSEKNWQISADDKVYVMYVDQNKHHYLSLTGTAEIVVDKNKTDELWNSFVKAWFPEGKDDPQLSLIKVKPKTGHYWDTKNGKLVTLIRIAVAAVTGNGEDGSVEGDIRI